MRAFAQHAGVRCRSADPLAELSGFAEAGCGRVHFWPLGAEGRQVDLIASKVLPVIRP